MNRAVFLDRDGIITQDCPPYIYKLSQLRLMPRAAEAIRLLNQNGVKVIVVSNQSGVARGYYSEDEVKIFNRAMEQELEKKGAHIDAIYYCPHHPEAKIEKYSLDCDCRKPKPGMLEKAAKDLKIELKHSYMLGDKWSDIEAGNRAGCKTIKVRSKYDYSEIEGQNLSEATCIVMTLYEAVEWITKRDEY